MRANERWSEALRSSIAEGARKLKKRLRRARRADEAGVHDSRTVLRRLRAQVDILGRTSPGAVEPALNERLHDVEKALGRVRDTDVLLETLDQYQREHPRDRRALEVLERALRRRRRRAASRLGRLRHVTRGLRREILAFAEREAEKAEEGEERARSRSRVVPRRVRDFVRQETWRKYDAALAFARQLPTSPEALHRYRAACRELRFAVELVEGAVPSTAPIARDLHAVQNQIGQMHDHDVGLALIRKWLRDGTVPHSTAIVAYAKWNRAQRDGLRRRYRADWLAFLGRPFRERLARALEDERPAS
jgi:CHAD domain-containing protein